MIAAWMIYSIGIALLLYGAGLGVDLLMRATRGPSRATWFVAMLAALLFSALSAIRPSSGTAIAVPASASAVIPAVIVRYAERGVVAAAQAVNTERFADRSLPLATLMILGSLIALLYLAGSFARLARLARQFDRTEVEGQAVLVSRDFGPALLGFVRTRIVLPRWVLSLPSIDRRLILEHERSHALARDPGLLVIALLTLALQPWNPALWLMFLRLRLAIEMDCDARVLRARGDVARYGKLLVEVYERATPMLAPQIAFGARPTNLERRIRRMTVAGPRVVSLRAAGALAASGLAVVAACEAPRPSAKDTTALAASITTSNVSVTSGVCAGGIGPVSAAYAHVYETVTGRHPHAGTDSILGAIVDENCNVLADRGTRFEANWKADSVIREMFRGVFPPDVRAGAARMKKDGPFVVFALQPSKAWQARLAADDCGFNTRSNEVCNLVGPVELRRLDERRLLIAVRGSPAGTNDPARDHMFLVSSLVPLPGNLTRSIEFGRVIYHGNAVFVENRAATETPFLFGASFSSRLSEMRRPMTKFDEVIGIAHYRAPVVTVDQVKNVRPASRCDGPRGSCFEVNGRRFDFPA